MSTNPSYEHSEGARTSRTPLSRKLEKQFRGMRPPLSHVVQKLYGSFCNEQRVPRNHWESVENRCDETSIAVFSERLVCRSREA